MIRGTPKAEREQMVREALQLIRMEGYEHHYPRQLSGGQQQRVGLARALVYRPKVLLLDEPLSNLDAKLREEMRFEIKDLQLRLGITAIYVTHDQEEALALSDRVAIMNAGRIEQVGTPEEIYEQPRSHFVADFIGLSDFLEGTVVELEPGGRAVLSVGQLKLAVPAPDGVRTGDSLLMFIRPNEIRLSPPGEREEENTFEGVVTKKTYLGDKIDYRVKLAGDLELRVQTDGDLRFSRGERVRVLLPFERCRAIREE
jgi:ABC-type Fe3+/spermidine/putrescine transport system ATPase subunit